MPTVSKVAQHAPIGAARAQPVSNAPKKSKAIFFQVSRPGPDITTRLGLSLCRRMQVTTHRPVPRQERFCAHRDPRATAPHKDP